MSKKRMRRLDNVLSCNECGNTRLSALDRGHFVCYECGWSYSNAHHASVTKQDAAALATF